MYQSSFVLTQRAGQKQGPEGTFTTMQHDPGAYSEQADKSLKSSTTEKTFLVSKISNCASVQPCTRPPQILLFTGRAHQLSCSIPLLHKVGFCSRSILSLTLGLCVPLSPAQGAEGQLQAFSDRLWFNLLSEN